MNRDPIASCIVALNVFTSACAPDTPVPATKVETPTSEVEEKKGAALVVVLDSSDTARATWTPEIDGSDFAAGAVYNFLDETKTPPETMVEAISVDTGLDVQTLYRDEAPRAWTASVEDPDPRRAWASGTVKSVRALTPPAKNHEAANILHALWQAGRILQESGAKTRVLWIISSLRDRRPDRWDFSREIPVPENVTASLAADGSMPDLGGVEVHVCGVHTGASRESGPPDYYGRVETRTISWSPRQHQELTKVWQAVFTATGASSVSIVERCPVLSGTTTTTSTSPATIAR